MGNNFLEKISSTFFLECGWCWHIFFIYSFDLQVFEIFDVIHFWIYCLEREENEKKYFKRKKFQKWFFGFCFVSLVIRTFSTAFMFIIFWLDAFEMEKITKTIFQWISKKKFSSEKSKNFHCVFLSICTVFTCARSLVLWESALEMEKIKKILLKKSPSKKNEAPFSCHLQAVDYFCLNPFLIQNLEHGEKNKNSLWEKNFFFKNWILVFLEFAWYWREIFTFFSQFARVQLFWSH